MTNICLKDLTDKQRDVWRMRYRYGWCMTKIALEMGIKKSAVSQLLQRAHCKAGLPKIVNFTVKPTKGRRFRRAMSLSDVFNY